MDFAGLHLAGDGLEPASEGPTMELVRHMLNVIEQQQAQLASVREANATLRAQLADARSGLSVGQPAISIPVVEAPLPQAAHVKIGSATDDPALDAAARLTRNEALASLVDLASAREYEPGLVVATIVASPDRAGAKRPHAEPTALRCVATRPSSSAPSHGPALAEGAKLGWALTALAPAQPGGIVGEAPAPWRRCRVCGTTDSPKWRQRNTLCNACGLRTAKTVRGSLGKPQAQDLVANAQGSGGVGDAGCGDPPAQPATLGGAQQLAPLSSNNSE
jgi:hypothetical protein